MVYCPSLCQVVVNQWGLVFVEHASHSKAQNISCYRQWQVNILLSQQTPDRCTLVVKLYTVGFDNTKECSLLELLGVVKVNYAQHMYICTCLGSTGTEIY